MDLSKVIGPPDLQARFENLSPEAQIAFGHYIENIPQGPLGANIVCAVKFTEKGNVIIAYVDQTLFNADSGVGVSTDMSGVGIDLGEYSVGSLNGKVAMIGHETGRIYEGGLKGDVLEIELGLGYDIKKGEVNIPEANIVDLDIGGTYYSPVQVYIAPDGTLAAYQHELGINFSLSVGTGSPVGGGLGYTQGGAEDGLNYFTSNSTYYHLYNEHLINTINEIRDILKKKKLNPIKERHLKERLAQLLKIRNENDKIIARDYANTSQSALGKAKIEAVCNVIEKNNLRGPIEPITNIYTPRINSITEKAACLKK